MSENQIYKNGSDLVATYTAEDSSGEGITGLTVQISIYKISTARYFDNATGLFDSVAEVLNTASEIGYGQYKYTMTGAYDADSSNYDLRVVATESVSGDVANKRINQSMIGIPEAIKVKTDNLPHSIKKNTAISDFKFVMLDSTTGDPTAGLIVSAARKLDADASWTSMTGSITDNGDGAYSIDINATDTNGDTGVWRFTASNAKTTLITFITEET